MRNTRDKVKVFEYGGFSFYQRIAITLNDNGGWL